MFADKQQNRPGLVARIALTLAFVLLGIAYFIAKQEEFSQLEWPSAFAIIAVSVAFTTNLWLNSLFNVIIIRRLDAGISKAESFALSTVTSAANFILPLRAGAGIRAAYMKRVFHLPYTHFASTLVIFYLANIFVACIAGMIAVLVIFLDTGLFKIDLFLLPPAVFLITGILMFRRSSSRARDELAGSPWRMFVDGYRRILADRRSLLVALLVVAISFTVSTIGWAIALREYVPAITVAEVFLIVASQIIGGLTTLTAGGTGFQEAAGLYVGHRLGVTLVQLFAVLVWTKVLRILIAFLLAAPSMLYLRKRMQTAAP